MFVSYKLLIINDGKSNIYTALNRARGQSDPDINNWKTDICINSEQRNSPDWKEARCEATYFFIFRMKKPFIRPTIFSIAIDRITNPHSHHR